MGRIMSPVDRRAFLKGVAMATAAVAGSAIAPAVVAQSRAGRPAGARGQEGALAWKRAPCMLCGVGCGLLVGIQNGRAVSVKGDPDSPGGRGLACVKGYHAVQTLYGRDRIRRAMVRRNGSLVEVPLREALDVVAGRIRDTVQEYGSDGVGVYGSAEWSIADGYVAGKLFKGGLGTNNVDGSTGLRDASGLAGLLSTFGMAGPVGRYEDIDHADVFVLWDGNLAETEPVVFSRLLERRRTSPGVRIIDLTTRTTRTSYAADRSLLHRPGTALAVANAVCHDIIARRRVNRAFVDRHVAFSKGRTDIGHGPGDDLVAEDTVSDATWNEYVRFLDAYSPDRAPQLTGIGAEEIRWLAGLYADPSRRVMSLWGAEANGDTHGTWLNNCIYNIHLLVGKIAEPGNGALCLTAGPGPSGIACDAGALAHSLPRGTVRSADDRALAARIWGVPANRIAARPGRAALSMFRAFDRGDVRLIWVQRANPLVELPNLNRYRAAAGRADRFLVVSDVYPTATTDMADVVLPSALWIECEGLYAGADGRMQHFGQLLTPPGDAMGDAWQMIEVARRLGMAGLFPWTQDGHVEAIWAEYARFRQDPALRMPPLSELRQTPGLLWPFISGKETRWRYGTPYDPAADALHGRFDFYGQPDHRARIWLRPHQPPPEAPDRAFPFRLDVGRVLEHTGTGSLTRRVPTLHRAVPRAWVELNRQDAEELGIRNGDTVRLTSRRGSLRIEARIDYRSQPARGQLFAPAFDDDAPVNVLTPDAFCPLSGQPAWGACAVRVQRLTGRQT
jgi:nitrate reductase (cytochrome)